MVSKNRIKQIKTLAMKKRRDESGLFIGEGPKVVGELLNAFPCVYLAALPEWISKHPESVRRVRESDEVTFEELKKMSFLQAPQNVLGVFSRSDEAHSLPLQVGQTLCLALDDVQDPGNLGTIIRLADWFGISDIVCSLKTADAYGPKTVQATMGALARVNVHYVDLPAWLNELPSEIPVYGTFLNGKNIYTQHLSQKSVIVMGNEGNGISKDVESLVTERLYIPNYPEGRNTSESLNVAVATAVTCAEFRRQASFGTFLKT